ncbi:MAG: lamin tail domain-containing protein [bacterium]|nr:lamin tail domain-containing protein [bacterium]MBK7671886.1 lamin tail domain-containing protein [bacterium]
MTHGRGQTAAGWLALTVLAVLLAWALPAQTARAELDPGIIINEVLADPALDWNGDGVVDAKNDEWIEIRNIDTVPIDLSQYWLRDSSGDTPDLQLSGMADPDEHIVFFGSDSVAWQAANGLSQTGFALNNTGDLVQLLRTIPGTDPVQYELMFAVSIYDHGAEDDRSCGFDAAHVEWLLFDVLNPYPGVVEPVGSGCAPSPGAPNLCGQQVPTEAASFGDVKATYR